MVYSLKKDRWPECSVVTLTTSSEPPAVIFSAPSAAEPSISVSTEVVSVGAAAVALVLVLTSLSVKSLAPVIVMVVNVLLSSSNAVRVLTPVASPSEEIVAVSIPSLEKDATVKPVEVSSKLIATESLSPEESSSRACPD